jgi:hypothetical protein
MRILFCIGCLFISLNSFAWSWPWPGKGGSGGGDSGNGDSPIPGSAQDPSAVNAQWRITRTTWTDQDEQNFGQFLVQLGAAVEKQTCWKVDTCLNSPANMYFGSDPSGFRYVADCADLPYFLRGYFAWKNGLPFSIEAGVRAKDDSPDVRYSKEGNYVTGRFDILSSRNKYPNASNTLAVVTDDAWSASYRMIGLEDGNLFTDFYPAELSRRGIHLGTVIYDPNGHVTIIYKITDDGRIYYIDSHPDNTLTSGMYTPKFERSRPGQGAGFKNFRPLSLVGARQDSSGAYYGGHIVGAKNAQLPGFSIEQYYGNNPDPGGDWTKGKFVLNGQELNYYDYVRFKMSSGDLRIDPIRDMQQLTADICTSLRDRVVAVDQARVSGVQNKTHPDRLPANIFGSDGEWENFATPSRDARLKVSFMDLLDQAKQNMGRYRAHDPSIVYNGGNLGRDLLNTYNQVASGCQFAYTNSAGASVPLNLEVARQRLFGLSFDPYHCVELRWGASTPAELASCPVDQNKSDWYSHERWLRYQWERTYDAKMDYSLDELDGPKPGAGIAAPPDVDIVKYLNSVQ